jgi:hypothetical protein
MSGWNGRSGVCVPVERADSTTPLTLASDRSLIAVLSSIVSAEDWCGVVWCGVEMRCDVV